jgi:trehalose 6-phosphate phosphatase
MDVTRNILSKVGLLELNRFVSSGRCLMVFDFDGTLAPIVNDPESAALDSQFLSDLSLLSHVYEILILTGRSVEDVRKRLPGLLVDILGNHGLEGNKRVTDDLLLIAKNLTREWIRTLS